MAKQKHVEKFAEDVRSLFEGRVDRIILYGSYAREEEVPGSDIDIAIVLTEKKRGDRKKVQELAEKWMQKTELRFSPRVFELEEFQRKVKENYSFYKNIEEEGFEI